MCLCHQWHLSLLFTCMPPSQCDTTLCQTCTKNDNMGIHHRRLSFQNMSSNSELPLKILSSLCVKSVAHFRYVYMILIFYPVLSCLYLSVCLDLTLEIPNSFSSGSVKFILHHFFLNFRNSELHNSFISHLALVISLSNVCVLC
jgi:hypothetical protein